MQKNDYNKDERFYAGYYRDPARVKGDTKDETIKDAKNDSYVQILS